jgi:hypothetical protein
MHATEPGMPKRSGRELPGPASGKDRFDGESARRILQRAAAEQQRLKNELADSYSYEELEEMAAEAGISSEALRAAVEAHESKSGIAAAGTPLAPHERPRRRLSAVKTLMPGNWSTAVKGVALTTAGGIGVVGLLLAFPAVAEAVFWALLLFLILLAVLVVLGASPF